MSTSDVSRIGEVVETSREPEDMVMWSVTTILAVIDRPALIPWAVGVTAERAVANIDTVLNRLEKEGADSAIEYVKGLRWQTGGRLTDAELGTVAHKLFDTYAIDEVRPEVVPELHPDHARKGLVLAVEDVIALNLMLDRFDEFLQLYQPDYECCEIVVFHPEQGYAGQVDAFLSIGGVPLIGDYKTSRNTYDSRGKIRAPYPEASLQLAAYRYARYRAAFRARRYETGGRASRRYYLLSSQERDAAWPVPEVEGGIVIKITPEHLGVYPVRCGPEQFETFRFVQEVARWSFQQAAHAVGNPMPPLFPDADLSDPFAGLPEE